MAERYIDEKEFAEMIGLSVKYAQKLARDGKGPGYYQFGRFRKYKLSEVERWMESCYVSAER